MIGSERHSVDRSNNMHVRLDHVPKRTGGGGDLQTMS